MFLPCLTAFFIIIRSPDCFVVSITALSHSFSQILTDENTSPYRPVPLNSRLRDGKTLLYVYVLPRIHTVDLYTKMPFHQITPTLIIVPPTIAVISDSH